MTEPEKEHLKTWIGVGIILGLIIWLLQGCYFSAGPAVVPGDAEYCDTIDYQSPGCEDYYAWTPGYWDIYHFWHPGHYGMRPGWRHRYPSEHREHRWR